MAGLATEKPESASRAMAKEIVLGASMVDKETLRARTNDW